MTWRSFVISISCLAVFHSFGMVCAEDGNEFFEKHIRPILVEHCYECHGGVHAKGGLKLDTREGWLAGGDSGPVIVPGQAVDSLLLDAVNHGSLEMPPAESGQPLSSQQIQALEHWIEIGAPDPRIGTATLAGMSQQDAQSWWAFQRLPKATADPSPTNIDAFVNSRLAEHDIVPVAPANKRTLIRRATYDLTGLPPTSDEVDAFLSDESDYAYDELIDRLIASPQYGVRWGRHWLDVVRYADTAGENSDRPLPHAWRYRNWVIESFNRDPPFDEFARLQLAGDLLCADAPRAERNEGVIATGYLAIARRFGHDIDHNLHLMYEDVIDNLGKSFLGLTTGCARCHDHKYDPITTKDYYALYGIFHSTRFAFPGCEPRGQPYDLVPLISQSEMDELENTDGSADILEAVKNLQTLQSDDVVRTLSSASVAEGALVTFADGANENSLRQIEIRKGEVLQLTVEPNASHGADSTRVEWQIAAHNGTQTWNVSELISDLTQSNPHAGRHGSTWCFYTTAEEPAFLATARNTNDGRAEIQSWNLGDTPSVFVNSADQAVKVWTELRPRCFHVHPGPARPVTVAWVSPMDGYVQVTGLVADAHPSGGDGVAFRLLHIAVPDFGQELIRLGELERKASSAAKTAIPVAYAVGEAEPMDAAVQRAGDPVRPGEVVPRRWLSVFGGHSLNNDRESGRRELAAWVTDQPLFARVMANRLWQWHFQQGLVTTPNNFGSRGEMPTHPELLDWLASQFAAGGFRLKPMHRLLMKSKAYRRSSLSTPKLDVTDPRNRWLARFERRRLSAEEIRDSLLFVSGRLDQSPGEQHPFPAEETWKFTQHDPFDAIYDSRKRSAYLMVQRQRRHPYLGLFDGADPNASTAWRQSTTVPTQALYFMNDEFFHEQAGAVAKRLFTEPNKQDRLRQLYRILFQRAPGKSEAEVAQEFFSRYPSDAREMWRAYARILMASNEFIFVD